MIPAAFVKLEIALGSDPGTASPTWTDITSRFGLISWSCGRVDPTQPMNPRQGRFTINNRDNAFNPFAVSTIEEDTPIRYSIVADGTTYVRFLGYIDEASVQWTWPEGGEITFSATDRSKFIAGETNLSTGEVLGERTDERVARICDLVSIDASDRDIDVTAREMVQTDFRIDAVSALDACVTTENVSAAWFVDRQGTLRFDGRHAIATRPRTATVQARFSTVTGEAVGTTFLPFSAPVPGFARRTKYNRVTVTNALGETAEATAGGRFEQRHPNVTTQSTVSPLIDAEPLLTIYNRQLRYLSRITCTPTVDDSRAADLAALDLRDRVQVRLAPPGGAAVIDIECTVEAITETAQSGGWWSVELGLYPTEGFDALDPADWMIVGDADTGRVGTGIVAP